MIPQPHQTLLNRKKLLEKSYINSLREINPLFRWRAFSPYKKFAEEKGEIFYYKRALPAQLIS
jgi:hypothetical protein